MKITTRGRYALRVLARLAAKDESVSLAELAEAEGISKKYLEQIVPLLTRAGILQASRGVQGGYRLARPPEQVTVGEVLRLTEGEFSTAACLRPNAETCPRREDCAALPLWQGLTKVVYDYLDGFTLADLKA